MKKIVAWLVLCVTLTFLEIVFAVFSADNGNWGNFMGAAFGAFVWANLTRWALEDALEIRRGIGGA
jgi:hypothetical protein